MIQKIYSIKDNRSHQFGVPFTAVNDDIAKRTTALTLLQVPKDHIMFQYAGDYELYYLGEVSDDGTLISCENGAKALIFLDNLVEIEKVNERRKDLYEVLQQEQVPESAAE